MNQRIINLVAAMAAITVFGLTFGLMFPLLAIIMEREGLPANLIGINSAMQPIGILLAGFFIPKAVKRFGARAIIVTGALITAAIALTYPFVPIYWTWFFLRIAHGFFVSFLFAVSEALIVKYAAGPYRSRILALYTSILALSFGGGPLLISLVGTEGVLPFAIGACILVVATIPLLFLKDDQSDDDHPDAAMTMFAFLPKAPLLLFAIGVFGIIDAANLGFLPVYGLKKGLAEADAAMLLSVFIFGNVVLQLPIGWLADHAPKRLVMLGCAVATAAACALVPITFGTVWQWPLLLIAGAASVGIYTVALSELGDRFSGSDLMAGMAGFSTMWGFGALLGALISGWSFEALGPDGFFYVQVVIFMCFVAAMGLGIRRA